jgi:hypothetical protein
VTGLPSLRALDQAQPAQLRLLQEDGGESGRPSVLIGGDHTSLRLLAELIQAVIDDIGCGCGIPPAGAGNVHFASKSELGVYLSAFPCADDKIH